MSNLVKKFKKILFIGRQILPGPGGILLLILLSLTIRLPGLMWGIKPYPKTEVDWYDVDERTYIVKAVEIASGISRPCWYPLGFPLQIAMAQKIFHIPFASVIQNLLLGRILSLLYGMGLLWIIYLIATTLWTRKEAILAMIITAGIPLLNTYSHLSTANMANTFYFYLLVYLAILFQRKNLNLYHIFILGVCSALGISMMANFIMLIPPLLLIVASRRKNRVAFISIYLILTITIFFFTNWHQIGLSRIIHQFHNDLICRLPGHKDIYNLIIIPFNLVIYLTLPIFILGIKGLKIFVSETKPLLYKLYLAIPPIMYTAILLLVDVPFDRYFLPILPFFALLSALGASKLKLKSRKAVFFFSFLYLYTGAITVEYNFWWDNRQKAYVWITSHIPPQSKIYLGRYFSPYEFYFFYKNTFPLVKAEYAILHERYYRRYLRSVSFPFTPIPPYVYHGVKSDFKAIPKILRGKDSYKIIKRFPSLSILPEYILRKRTLGSYPDIIGDVIIARKLTPE